MIKSPEKNVPDTPYPQAAPAHWTSLAQTPNDDENIYVPDQQALMDVFMAGLAKESDSDFAAVIFLSYSCHIPVIFLSFSDIFLTYSSRIPGIFLSYSNNILS
jgi:hypothetical protein